jgi:hypothetical protein
MSQRVASGEVGGGTHEPRGRATSDYQPDTSLAKGVPSHLFSTGLVNPYLIPANYGGYAAPLELKVNNQFGKVSPINVTYRDFLHFGIFHHQSPSLPTFISSHVPASAISSAIYSFPPSIAFCFHPNHMNLTSSTSRMTALLFAHLSRD